MTDTLRRIAFCITELDPGGAERALVQVVTRLDRTRWEPRVFCLSGPGEMVQPLEKAGIRVACLDVRSRWDVGIVGRLKREFAEFRPHILQTFLFHANIAGRLAAWRAKVPVVVSGVRVVEQDANWRMRLDRLTNRLVTHNVCVSEAVADAYRGLGFASEKLSVIPNGVDVERYASAEPADLSEFGIPSDATTFLAVGRLHPQKGFDLLLEAIGPLLESYPNLHLLIAGEGPQRRGLEETVSRLPAAARVHLPGRRDDMPSLMRACDLFILSSRWEGMPNVVLEAMAAGLPVLATNVEGVQELIVTGESGFIIRSGSVEDLRDGINLMLDEPPSAKSLAEAAQQRVRRDFTWEATVEAYDRLYQRLLS